MPSRTCRRPAGGAGLPARAGPRPGAPGAGASARGEETGRPTVPAAGGGTGPPRHSRRRCDTRAEGRVPRRDDAAPHQGEGVPGAAGIEPGHERARDNREVARDASPTGNRPEPVGRRWRRGAPRRAAPPRIPGAPPTSRPRAGYTSRASARCAASRYWLTSVRTVSPLFTMYQPRAPCRPVRTRSTLSRRASGPSSSRRTRSTRTAGRRRSRPAVPRGDGCTPRGRSSGIARATCPA